MLREPAAEAHIIKADLAGLVLELMQGPSLQSVAGLSTVVLNSLYGFSCQPAGRQQLLDKLTTDSSRIMVDLSLKYLEAPNPCHASLVVAAGENGRTLLLCSFRSLIALWIILDPAKQPKYLNVCHVCNYQAPGSVQHLIFPVAFILCSCIHTSCSLPEVTDRCG